MKTIFKTMLFTLLLMMSLMSCNQEELFVEPVSEEEVINEETDETTDEEDESNEDSDENSEVDPNLPCDFTLDNVQANSTVIINCIMDLGGQTITLPANVTIVYEGGDIINGTLNFSEGSVISGELLNSTLTLGGSNPILKDTTFDFIPSRWDIVEGVVSDEIAMENKLILKSLLNETKTLGVTTFKIDELDAYFKVNGDPGNAMPVQQAIMIPSNFNLIMTDNTHLRVQPNDYPYYTLLSVYKESNITIEGGTLHGDRDEHDYSSGGSHEWGHMLTVRGGTDVVLRNIVMMDGTGDGLDIQGEGHAVNPDYAPTRNLLAIGCKFIRNRRNNVSITACDGVIIEDSDFIDAGIHTAKSQGTPPSWGLDVEALEPNEKAENIIIRNCREQGSRKGGFLVAIGDFVTFEGNYVENPISLASAENCIIRNNEIVAKSETSIENGGGINTGRADRGNQVYGSKVYGNKITGFSTGITVSNYDMEVYDNTIIDCKRGIVIGSAYDSRIYDNVIDIQNRTDSDGLMASGSIDNCSFENNTINADRFAVRFLGLNNQDGLENNKITLSNNSFTGGSQAYITDSKGMDIVNNTFNNQMQFFNCNTVELSANNVNNSNYSPSIYLRQVNSNFVIKDNVVNNTPNYPECVVVTDTNDLDTIVVESNQCN
ncbi:uronase [Flaviramulus sp. BrNp1-15]|uniref:right-handed parallel beta-helix repeat-containing protein n=1 Tax=Flaviramulus sp. BrNp1-15 TaxID=2916754 RepID=UPI001EE862D5|nr:right-handed parallel beta-helix repeat-containing protein [Flaviramulus sp. BrNp1-15]ULC58279.1 uronase [Flaviramulus sp. BrNp1-15]